MSHSAEKNHKGGPFTLIRFCRLRLKSKNQKGVSLKTQKLKQRRTVPKQNRKSGPFSPVRFCRLRLKSKKPKGDHLE